MTHNRPRHSVLNLFDPLMSSPSSRDVMNSSPDSDKENSSPGSNNDLTALFLPRAYKTPPQPPAFKRRLIDVGDATIDDISILAEPSADDDLQEQDEDDENVTLTFREMAISCSPKSPEQKDAALYAERMLRTPLAELILEDDATPIPKSKTYLRHFSPPGPFPPLNAFAAPRDNPRSLSPSIISSFPGPDMEGSDVPEIHISPAENPPSPLHNVKLETIHEDVTSQASSSLNLEDPIDFPSSTLTSYRGHLRPGARTNSGAHPNRCSADLYSSFFMQMQSAESSFDLLNDKISFLGQENNIESVLEGMEDESFDLQIETAKMVNTLYEVAANSALVPLGGSLETSHINSSHTDEPHLTQTETGSQTHETATSVDVNPSTPASSSHSQLCSVTPRLSRDGPALPPPPVPALRIVKRQNIVPQMPRPVQRNSVSSQSSTKPVSKRPSSAGLEAIKRPVRAITPPTTISGPGANVIVGSGPRRVLVNEDQKPNAAIARPGSRTISSSAPKRLPISGHSEPVPPSKPTLMSGLKPPTRYGNASTSSSALPRPVSTSAKVVAAAPGPDTGRSKFTSLLGRGLPARR